MKFLSKIIVVIILVLSVSLVLSEVKYTGYTDAKTGIHNLTVKVYPNRTTDEPMWIEFQNNIEFIDGSFELGLGKESPLFVPEPGEDYFIEVYLDDELIVTREEVDLRRDLETTDIHATTDIPGSGGEILEEMTPSLEIGDQVDDVIVLSGTDFGIGLATGTDASSRFEVQGGASRFWDGSATIGYATGEGDAYIEDQLEVDNTIYASHYRDNAAGNLINGGSGIGVVEDADGSWTISNTSSNTDDQNLSLVGTNLNIEDGSGVSLAAFMDNTDTQDLSIVDHTISLVDGGSVTVPDNYNADNAPTATVRGEPTRNEIETWANGVDDDNYADALSVTGTTTKTITVGRTGALSDLTATFTDLAADNDWNYSSGSGITGDIYHNGDVGIGVTSPSHRLHINENIRTDNVLDEIVYLQMNHTTNDDNGIAHHIEIPAWGDGSVIGYEAETSIDDPHSFDGNVLFRGLQVTDWSSGGSAYGGYSSISVSRLSDASAAGFYGNVSASSPSISASGAEWMTGIRGRISGTINESSGNFHSAAIYGQDDASGTGDHYAGYFSGNVRVTGQILDSSGDPGTSGQVLSSTATGSNWITPTATGDITAVTAGNDLDGGGTSGAVTLNIEPTLDYVTRINMSTGSIYHGGTTGITGQASGWTPGPYGASGVFVENYAGEGGGFYADADVACIWSPGDPDLLRIYDEDDLPSPSAPDVKIDGSGNVCPGTDNTRSVGTSSFRWNNGYFTSLTLGGVTRTSWPTGATSQWTDGGTYKYVNGNTNVRAYESGQAYGLYGSVPLTSSGTYYGIYGNATGSNTATTFGGNFYGGVYSGGGMGGTHYGIRAEAEWGNNNYGVYGEAASANSSSYGVYGTITSSSGTGYAIYGNQGSGNYAGYFNGDVRVTGILRDSSGDAGTSGQVLSSTGTGTNWVAGASGDITSVVAGNDLDGGSSSGTATLNIEPSLDYVDYINDLVRLSMTSGSSYDKIRVYNSSSYAIGMVSGLSFGYLNDWAMTFTFNNDTDRGFLWRDEADAASDGAMSLTTDGRLTVKNLVRAPVYYDHNNLSYYLDPAGSSYLNLVYGVNSYFYRMYDRNNTSFYVDPASTSYMNDVRGSIFYDRDNTSYYANPASSSRFNTIYSYYVHPWSNGAYDLGNTSYRWRYAWINGIYLNGSYRNSWPSSGGTSQWTDAGDYLYGTEYSSYRWYETTSYWTYFSGDNNGTHKHYIYNSDNASGSSYSSQRDNYYAYNYWGNNYSSSIFGNSYLDYDRAAGVMGYNSSDWGALAYQNSSGTEYGGYFYGGYTGGSGFFGRGVEDASGRLLAGMDGEVHIDNAIGAWGDLFGADIHGEVYGMFIEGGRIGQYTHGDRYVDGLDVHLIKGSDDQTHVTFTSRALDASVYCDGNGELSSGSAFIEFPDEFKAISDESKPITVTCTPMGDCNGVHIVSVNSDGFRVAENNDGSSNISFNWIAIARSTDDLEKTDLPQEVVDGQYASKVKNGYYADGDLQREGNGLYFINGELVDEVHSSTIPTEELIALKTDFSENPKSKTYQQWYDAFAAIGEEDMMMTEDDYNAFIDTPEKKEIFFDEYGVQIPSEWLEELRAEGVQLYTKEETLERRKKDLIDTARARREAESTSENTNPIDR